MKIVFFGSSKYSTIVQKALNDKFDLALVVTAPDKPSGRQRKLTPTPVKEFALKNKVQVITPAKLDKSAIKNIAKVRTDFLVACDYGLILPPELLKVPKYDALNVHHSLLPKYRGPTPAPSAILAGEKKSGVTIISMIKKVDSGDILAQKEYVMRSDETTDSLLARLNTLGAQLVIEIIDKYLTGSIKKIKQDDSKATYTHRLKKEDGYIDIDNPPDPVTFNRMVHAFYSWPGVWTEVKWKVESGKWKVLKVKFLPGNLVQPEGKKPMAVKEFLNGYPRVKGLLAKLHLT